MVFQGGKGFKGRMAKRHIVKKSFRYKWEIGKKKDGLQITEKEGQGGRVEKSQTSGMEQRSMNRFDKSG